MTPEAPVVNRVVEVPNHGTLLFLVTEDWYFASHRLDLARQAVAEGYRVVVATRVHEHGEILRQAGCELAPLDWVRGAGHPLTELRFLRCLVSLYRELRPVAVHHVALKPVVYGSIAARLTGVPVVINAIAGLGYVFTNRSGMARLLRPVIRAGLRHALNARGTWVIVQNPDDQALLVRETGLDPRRCVLIRGAGVDLESFRAGTPEPSLPAVVLLPARMLWDKGVGEFAEAARRLRAEGLTVRFVLVGGLDPGNPRAVDEATLRGWVQEGVVEWWEHQAAMAEIYPQAHIVVLPSYREGLPKALLEAAACGRAIITTDAPGCREVVAHEDNGLLVPVRDPASLAAAIRDLVSDPVRRRRMGARGRVRMEAEFSVDEVVRRTLPLYRFGPPFEAAP